MGEKGNLPNLIVAGTVKGGTTSLFSYLSKHPEICISSVKETCFFLPLRYGNARVGIDQYQKYFSGCRRGEKYRVESTPGYLDGGRAVAEEIKAELGKIKIVFVLRNPVDRLKSFYRYQKAQMNLPKELTFVQYVEACKQMPFDERSLQENDAYWGIDGGLYVKYLADWFNVFGKDNIRVLFFDDLVCCPSTVLVELSAWLGIDDSVYKNMKFEVENKTVLYRLGMIHSMAIRANKLLEPFMRQVPAVKSIVRKMYYALNSESEKEVISEVDIQNIELFYEDANTKLATALKAWGYKYLPAWLDSHE